jgi:hypothetical protein
VTDTSTIAEQIRQILRPYSVNWSGLRGRGDLVIPQREIAQVVDEIEDALRDGGDPPREASDPELFDALMETRRSGSVQTQMELLRRRFKIVCR